MPCRNIMTSINYFEDKIISGDSCLKPNTCDWNSKNPTARPLYSNETEIIKSS